MATAVHAQVIRLSFWAKMTIGISVFIVFGFAQFALRGFVPYMIVPAVFHVHGVVMLAWLGLVVTQSVIVGRGGLAIHRKLGWASAVMLPVIVVLASATGFAGLRSGIFPPFFTPAYFLAVVHVGVLVLTVLVAAAVTRRHRPDWHKRLMVGAAIVLMEPALGRVLPMPLLVPWGGLAEMVVQLALVLLIVRHDRREMGALHPATSAVMLAIVLQHLLVELLAVAPPWISFAARFTA